MVTTGTVVSVTEEVAETSVLDGTVVETTSPVDLPAVLNTVVVVTLTVASSLVVGMI